MAKFLPVSPATAFRHTVGGTIYNNNASGFLASRRLKRRKQHSISQSKFRMGMQSAWARWRENLVGDHYLWTAQAPAGLNGSQWFTRCAGLLASLGHADTINYDTAIPPTVIFQNMIVYDEASNYFFIYVFYAPNEILPCQIWCSPATNSPTELERLPFKVIGELTTGGNNNINIYDLYLSAYGLAPAVGQFVKFKCVPYIVGNGRSEPSTPVVLELIGF